MSHKRRNRMIRITGDLIDLWNLILTISGIVIDALILVVVWRSSK